MSSSRALTESAPVLRRPVSPYGAPLRRLKNLGAPLPFWAPTWRFPAMSGKVYGTLTRGLIMGREASLQGLRDYGCEPWARAPLPAHVQFRLENVPQASGNGSNIADCEIVSRIKFTQGDISVAMPRAGEASGKATSRILSAQGPLRSRRYPSRVPNGHVGARSGCLAATGRVFRWRGLNFSACESVRERPFGDSRGGPRR